MRENGRFWTDTENDFIRNRWRDQTDAEMAEALDRTEGAVCHHRSQLGLLKTTDRPKPPGTRPWTREEEATLRDLFYNDLSDDDIAQTLGRTRQAVTQRRSTLRLARVKEPPFERTDLWTDEDDNMLSTMFRWGLTDEEIARRMSHEMRQYTVSGIRCRRQTLGLWRSPRE